MMIFDLQKGHTVQVRVAKGRLRTFNVKNVCRLTNTVTVKRNVLGGGHLTFRYNVKQIEKILPN